MRRLLVALSCAGVLACTTSLDLNAGRAYACAPDAGDDEAQCGKDFRCGLDGLCHGKGVTAAYPCASASDCEGGWVCGVEHTCHDPAVAAAYACRDATDCAGGWACGLEGVCHDPRVAAPWLCDGDERCSAGWRCGFAGRCLDPSAEVTQAADLPVGSSELVSPKLEVAPEGPTGATVAASSVKDEGRLALEAQRTVAVVTADGRVLSLLSSPRYPWTMVLSRLDGGSGVTSVATGRDQTVIAAGSSLVSMSPAGAVQVLATDGGVLSQRGNDLAQWAFDHERAWILSRMTSYLATLPFPSEDSSADVAIGQCSFLATGSGLFVAPTGASSVQELIALEAAGWSRSSPAALSNADCFRFPSVTYSDLHLRLGAENATGTAIVAVAYRTIRNFGGPIGNRPRAPQEVVVFDYTALAHALPPSRCTLDSTQQCTGAGLTTVFGPCQSPCNATETLTDFRPLARGFDVSVEVECTSPTSQRTLSLQAYPGSALCHEPVELTGRSSAFHDRRSPGFSAANPSSMAQVGRHGQLWTGMVPSHLEPVFLDQAPLGLVTMQVPDAGPVLAPVAESSFAVAHPSLGYVAGVLPEPKVVAVVEGSQSLVVTAERRVVSLEVEADGGTIDWPPPAAFEIDATAAGFQAPVVAKQVPSPFSTQWLLVSAGDSLYQAEVAASRDGGAAGTARLRLVPQPSVGITSFALASPDESDAGVSARGYLTTRAGVFTFAVNRTAVWSSRPVSVPPGVAVKVWSEGGRGRLLYDDGRVVSLPSSIPLAEAVSGGGATDALWACGQTYLLTPKGVSRLVTHAGGVGSWAPEPLPDKGVVVTEGIERGRLFAVDGGVMVFNPFGGALRFSPQGGCP